MSIMKICYRERDKDTGLSGIRIVFAITKAIITNCLGTFFREELKCENQRTDLHFSRRP